MTKLNVINHKLLVTIVLLALVGYLVFSFLVMTRPKGLRIYAPAINSNSAKDGNSSVNLQTFANLDPVAFSASFGLDYHKMPEKKVEIVEEKKPEVKKVETKKKVEIEPKTVDLHATGYRLKGIILEKDGNSAAFVYDPKARKTLVIREKSASEIRILSATMRSVYLITPDGEGELELEDAKGGKGRGSVLPTPLSKGRAAASSRINRSEKLLRQTNTSPNDVVGMISAGHFKVRPNRGNFQVEVRQVPDSFAGYGLRPGDKIIGTSNGNFKQSQDVALNLGNLSHWPTPIKIQRGRRTMYLSPPPPPEKDATVKSNPAVLPKTNP